MLDLAHRHVMVVGGSRGIGAATARLAAQAGADVSIVFRSDGDAAASVVRDVEASGRRAVALQADAAEEGAMEAAADTAVTTLGSLHGVVVSAGIFEGRMLEAMDLPFWERTIRINLGGTFLAVKAAVRKMREHEGGGSIVVFTSTAGQRGSAEYSAYATSKGAQILFMRSMAKELASDRIRANCVAPAWTLTDMAIPSIDAIGRETVEAGFPLGRIGLPEDAAGAAVYLLSDLAAFVTGSTVTVDGGMDMRG